jgi:hypothetical protein
VAIEEALLHIADRVLDFDEASLAQLQEKYLKKVSDFSPTPEWERAMVVYFIINSVRVKNKIFNEKVTKTNKAKNADKAAGTKSASKKALKLVK